MKKQEIPQTIRDVLEYLGSTTVQRTRCRGNTVIWRDWLLFDTVEEAQDYYHDTVAA
jgi:hypothetical protein